MKKVFRDFVKYILCGGLVCAGFTACSDDALVDGNQEVLKDKSPAYLSVAFSTAGNSSRSTADDANNKGDTDGTTPEDSGHKNVGTEAENKINSALVVVLATDKSSGYAKLYNAPNGGFQNGLVAENIELSATTYDVLVVVNPYASLTSNYTNIETTAIKEVNDVKALYQAILDGKTPEITGTDANGGAWNNFSGDAIQLDSDKKNIKGVMMANKKNCQVTLSPNSDTVAEVEVERVTSKITFRPKNGNVYEVQVPDLTSVVIDFETDSEGRVYNKATYTDNDGVTQTIWVVLGTGDTSSKAYSKDAETGVFTELKNIADFDNLPGFKYVYKEGSYNTVSWYVKLEKYALVNLSKQVYNVRHTIAENSPAVPFGILTGSNYLYTPNWETKINEWTINDVKFNDEGGFDIADGQTFSTGDWFYNTLANVSEDSKKTSGWTYFRSFDSTTYGTNEDKVTGTEHYGQEEEVDDKTPAIGNLLAYCLENSTVEDKQTHGLSTGISFMAKIYSDENCETAISALYRYNGYLFQSIDAIKQAYDIDEKDANWANISESSDADALAKVGVVKYAGNTCYYYTTEIKHYDNGEELKLGNMEFAIMRNNIYSLSVDAVNIIGDPYVDPIPSTPNEVNKPKLDVKVEIMPWIVRYHDIEFN